MYLYINCYKTTSDSNHQVARQVALNKETANKHLEVKGTMYTLSIDKDFSNLDKVYVVMRIPQNKECLTVPVDAFDDIDKAKEMYLNYDYKKKMYRINDCFIVKN
jgi:hypothetical protein